MELTPLSWAKNLKLEHLKSRKFTQPLILLQNDLPTGDFLYLHPLGLPVCAVELGSSSNSGDRDLSEEVTRKAPWIFHQELPFLTGGNHEMDSNPQKKCRNVTSEFKNSLRNWTRVPSFWELRRIGWVEAFTRYFEETLHDCSIPSIRGTRPATPSSAGFPNASHHLPWFLVTVNQGVSPHFSGCLHSPLPSLVNIQKAIENGPVEIVDLPSYKIVIFHIFLYVYHSPYPMISPNLIGSMAKTHRWSPGNVPIRRSSVEGSTFLLEPAFFRMRRHRYERWDWLKGKLLRGIDMSWGYIRDTTHKIWLSNSWKTWETRWFLTIENWSHSTWRLVMANHFAVPYSM